MKNKFANIVRFGSLDSDNYYQNNSAYSSLVAKVGDIWRFLVPKADLKGNDYRFVNVVLVNALTNEILYNIGTVRLQEPELYSETVISVNSIPKTYKQFALTRQDGSSLFGTFRGQQQELYKYIQAIKKHYESYPYAPSIVFQDGQLLTIRTYFSDSFHLEGESITVGIGEVIEYNTNNPSISVTSLGTITIPAKDSYEISLSNVSEGNVFTIGTDSYVVASGDTIDTVKNYFYQGLDKLYVASGSTLLVNFDLGYVTKQNLVSPNVQAVYLNTTGGQDRYKITVTGQFVTGNIIQVQATGKDTIVYTVTSTSTKTSIEDVLNPDGGSSNQYYVTTGIVPLITVIVGEQNVANNNTPNFGLINKQTIASHNIDRYALFIVDNVVGGNVFNIGSDSYTAQSGDTIDNVLAYFGKTSTYFLVDVDSGTPFTAFAGNGDKYTDADIADITIVQQPQNRKSTQAVVDCSFRNVPSGNYRIALSYNEEVFQYGNYIEVKANIDEIFNHFDTPLIEVCNDSKCFDYDYIENNLSQLVRAELWVEFPKISIEENIYNLLDDGNVRGVTILRNKSKLVSNTVPIGTRDAYIQWLKHRELIIDGVSYICDGDVSQSQPANGVALFQISTSLTEQTERNNKDKFLSNSFSENTYARLILDTSILCFNVLLSDDIDTRYVNKEINVLAGEYKLMFVSSKNEKIELKFYRNGTLERTLILLDEVTRDNDFFRFYPYDEVVITANKYYGDVEITESSNEIDVTYGNVEYSDEINTLDTENGFGAGFDDGFN